MELSPYAAELVRLLTDPALARDPVTREPVDGARLSDEELGALAPAVRRFDRTVGYSTLLYTLDSLLRERQPLFTTETCAEMLDAVVLRARLGFGHPGSAVNALLHCTEPWPETTAKACGAIARSFIARGSGADQALLALANVGGGLTGQFGSRLIGRPLGAIAQDERAALVAAGSEALLIRAELDTDRGYDLPPPAADLWRRLGEQTGYHAFALRAVHAAADRAARVHAGELPFVADKAFHADEVAALGRAVRVLLLRDEPGLGDLLGPLLVHISVAPTAAKTLPSQALLYEIARATVDFPTPEVLAALRAARAHVRHKGVPKQLDRKLRRIEQVLADRPDVATRLPDLGFDRDGVLTVEVGGHLAILRATEDVTLTWRTPDGKEEATPPAALRREHADAVATVKDTHKRARGHLRSLGRALEASLQSTPAQPVGRWWTELAATGLGRALAGRLIWQIATATDAWQAVLPDGDAFVDLTGGVVKPEPEAAIRLWHPARADADAVHAWRSLLVDRDLRQPFKQAFREIYLITPAEEQTATESHRFAAHIVHYKQLYALLKGRGWDTRMLGPWDGGDFAEATRTLDGGAWRVVLDLEYLGEANGGVECVGTGRIRFEQLSGGALRRARLDSVPPLVFSEAMRDVDLFVGVTSVATDPRWTQRGGAHLAYWWDAGFGDLTETARTRRDALEHIVPRLAIADRCTLLDRWLVVEGRLGIYKIHLGSANILKEPDDAYLCIVPAKQSGPPLHLPFEDDRLSLILSKAFLLAADDRITDETILRQLRR